MYGIIIIKKNFIGSKYFSINVKICVKSKAYAIVLLKFDRGREKIPPVSICVSSSHSKSRTALDWLLNIKRIKEMSLEVSDFLHLTENSTLMNGINIVLLLSYHQARCFYIFFYLNLSWFLFLRIRLNFLKASLAVAILFFISVIHLPSEVII